MTINTETIRDAAGVLDVLTSNLRVDHPFRAEAEGRAKERVSQLYAAADEKALTLQEVAAQLGLAYSTVFAKRHQIGFRLPGSRVWRVWPSRLAELSAPRNNVTRLSLRVIEGTPCQSAKIKRPVSGKSISARQAARELDALLKPRTARPRRNTTTS